MKLIAIPLVASLALVSVAAGYHAHDLPPSAEDTPIDCPACAYAHHPVSPAICFIELLAPQSEGGLVLPTADAIREPIERRRVSPRAPPMPSAACA